MRICKFLTKVAKGLDDVGEGVACAGTAIESKTFTVGGKAFLFLGKDVARLKLGPSAEQAQEFAKTTDSAVRIGSGGWTTISFESGLVPKDPVLRRWVVESHSLFCTPLTAKSAGARRSIKATKTSAAQRKQR